jgi:aspartate-semialdehyde dehydrogenase
MSRESRAARVPAGSRSEDGFYRVAIVGAGTLKGKELAEVLPETAFPAFDVRLLDDDESLGQLEAVGDEATFVQSVKAENFEHVDFAFFTSEESFTRKHWRLAKDAGSMIVDLSYGLEGIGGGRVRAPWVERELGQTPTPELAPAPVVAAHPAAVTLALLILRAQRAAKIRSAVATVFEPASEHGRMAMDELHEQTVNLLSFQQMPRKVFDAQVAFNLVARYGENAQPPLESAERRIVQHFRHITGGRALVPSVLLLQAPIFHGHAFSLYLELEQPCPLADFTQVVADEHIALCQLAEDSPSNVAAAGQQEILLSVKPDQEHENGFWLWAAADNLRLQTLIAVECAQQLATARPRGKPQ